MSEEQQPQEEIVSSEKLPADPVVKAEKKNKLVMLKRCIGEAIGTAVLVAVGCGAATGLTLIGCSLGTVVIATAFAFGLVVTALSYALGEFTGCHANPAVTFAMFLDGRIGWKQALFYTISQVIGAIAGAGLLVLIFGSHISDSVLANVVDPGLVNTYASNSVNSLITERVGYGAGLAIGFVAEVFFALVFVFTILCTSHDKATKGLSGIALGLSLTSIVFMGFGITGTGLNPARSLGTALMAMINGQYEPIKEIWIFILGPYVGSALATLCYWLVWHDHGPHIATRANKPTDKIKEHIDSKDID